MKLAEATFFLAQALARIPWASIEAGECEQLLQDKLRARAVTGEGLGESVQQEFLPGGFPLWAAALYGKQGALSVPADGVGIGGGEPGLGAGHQAPEDEVIGVCEASLGHAVGMEQGEDHLIGGHD